MDHKIFSSGIHSRSRFGCKIPPISVFWMYSGLLTKNFPEYGKYSPSLAISSLIILGSSKAGPSISLHSQAPCPQGEVAQSCLTLCNPMDCSPPGSSSVHGIFQTRILDWVVISFSRGPSPPRDWTQVSYIAGRLFTIWATREDQRNNMNIQINLDTNSKGLYSTE